MTSALDSYRDFAAGLDVLDLSHLIKLCAHHYAIFSSELVLLAAPAAELRCDALEGYSDEQLAGCLFVVYAAGDFGALSRLWAQAPYAKLIYQRELRGDCRLRFSTLRKGAALS